MTPADAAMGTCTRHWARRTTGRRFCARCGADLSRVAGPASEAAKSRRTLVRLGVWSVLLLGVIVFAPRGFLSGSGTSETPRPTDGAVAATADPGASLDPGLDLTEHEVLGVLAISYGGLGSTEELDPEGGLPHVRASTADGAIVLDLYGPPNALQRISLTTSGIDDPDGAMASRRAITTFLGLYAPDAVMQLVTVFDDEIESEGDGTTTASSGSVSASLSADVAEGRAVVVVEPAEADDE